LRPEFVLVENKLKEEIGSEPNSNKLSKTTKVSLEIFKKTYKPQKFKMLIQIFVRLERGSIRHFLFYKITTRCTFFSCQ